MAMLVLLQGGEAKTFVLEGEETVLGRHPECAVHLESNMVSRKHARVIREGMRHYLEDLGSGNGTTVNGQAVTSKTLLNHEDRIKMGPMLLRFEDASAVSPTKRATSTALRPRTTGGERLWRFGWISPLTRQTHPRS